MRRGGRGLKRLAVGLATRGRLWVWRPIGWNRRLVETDAASARACGRIGRRRTKLRFGEDQGRLCDVITFQKMAPQARNAEDDRKSGEEIHPLIRERAAEMRMAMEPALATRFHPRLSGARHSCARPAHRGEDPAPLLDHLGASTIALSHAVELAEEVDRARDAKAAEEALAAFEAGDWSVIRQSSGVWVASPL